jgi:hypothetical protein
MNAPSESFGTLYDEEDDAHAAAADWWAATIW